MKRIYIKSFLLLLITLGPASSMLAKDKAPAKFSDDAVGLSSREVKDREVGCIQVSRQGMNKLFSFGLDIGLKDNGKLIQTMKKMGEQLLREEQTFDPSSVDCKIIIRRYCCSDEGRQKNLCPQVCTWESNKFSSVCKDTCNVKSEAFNSQLPNGLLWQLCPASMPDQQELGAINLTDLAPDKFFQKVPPRPITFQIPNFEWKDLEFASSDSKYDPKEGKLHTCVPVKKFKMQGGIKIQSGESNPSQLNIKNLSISVRDSSKPPVICFSTQLQNGKLVAVDWAPMEEGDDTDNQIFKASPNSLKFSLMSADGQTDLMEEMRQKDCFKQTAGQGPSTASGFGRVKVARVSEKDGVTLANSPLTELDQECIKIIRANFDNDSQAEWFFRILKTGNNVLFQNPEFLNSMVNRIVRPPLLDKINKSLLKEQKDPQSSINSILDYVKRPVSVKMPLVTLQDLIDTDNLNDTFLKVVAPQYNKIVDAAKTMDSAALSDYQLPLILNYLENSKLLAQRISTDSTSDFSVQLLDELNAELNNIREMIGINQHCISSKKGLKQLKEIDELLRENNRIINGNGNDPKRKINDKILPGKLQIISANIENQQNIQASKLGEDLSFFTNLIQQVSEANKGTFINLVCQDSPYPVSGLCDNSYKYKDDLYANVNLDTMNEILDVMYQSNRFNFCYSPSKNKKDSPDKEIDPKDLIPCSSGSGGSGIICRFNKAPRVEYDDGKKGGFKDADGRMVEGPHLKINISNLSCGLKKIAPIYKEGVGVYMRIKPSVDPVTHKVIFQHGLHSNLFPGSFSSMLMEVIFPLKIFLRWKVGKELRTSARNYANQWSEDSAKILPGIQWSQVDISPKSIGVSANLEYDKGDAIYWHDTFFDKKKKEKISAEMARHPVCAGDKK
jgi:hypothetical protein